MVRGFKLEGRQRNADLLEWLEVHDGDRWRYFNPVTGEESLPDRYLVWWRGNEPLISVEGGSNVQVGFAIQENHLDAISIAESQAAQRGAAAFDFSLYSLPIQTQAVYAVLLMIPIGALVMVVMRNIVGIDAFGTFMPVLIALAFRETQLFWGVLLFTLLVALGLSIRFLLDRLRLLLVPRLSAVLIVVVILMLIISMVSHRLGMETGLSVALFPMVIIAMTIERMSVLWEERGPGDAMRSAMGAVDAALDEIGTRRYHEFALFTERARVHSWAVRFSPGRISPNGPRDLSSLAALEGQPELVEADEVILLSNAQPGDGAVPSGWTVLRLAR